MDDKFRHIENHLGRRVPPVLGTLLKNTKKPEYRATTAFMGYKTHKKTLLFQCFPSAWHGIRSLSPVPPCWREFTGDSPCKT
jgi:hypothetical protein